MYKRLKKKKKINIRNKQKKNNNNNNNKTKPSKLTSSYFKCWLHWVYYIMKQMGDNEAYLLNALSTCEEPLISAGEGGGLLPRSVLNTASRVSY